MGNKRSGCLTQDLMEMREQKHLAMQQKLTPQEYQEWLAQQPNPWAQMSHQARETPLPLNNPAYKPLSEAQKHCYTSTILAAMEQMEEE